jgi:hypothetical protein
MTTPGRDTTVLTAHVDIDPREPTDERDEAFLYACAKNRRVLLVTGDAVRVSRDCAYELGPAVALGGVAACWVTTTVDPALEALAQRPR